MNTPIIWLMVASIIIWSGLGGYLAYLAIAQKRLAKRCNQLELMVKEDDR